MTLVNIDLRNVAGETGRHDQVVFHAPAHREGSAGQTIQTAPVIVDLEGGIGSVDLDPGPVVVDIRAHGWEDTSPKTVMVPEEGPITLTGLLLDAFEWVPVVVSEVRALTQRAESAADRAETVADTFGSLEGVAVSVQAAEDAATSAAGSASAAASSATAANDSQASAAGSATAAAQSAVNAANSEWVAGEHKGAAEAAATSAALSADDAAASAGAAASSESAAATSAGQADASASTASDAADRAENVVDAVQWQGDQLSVMGKVSPPLTGDDGATPYVGANGNWWVGDTDTGVRAQGEKGDAGDGAGDVLWSELNPVLDGKAPASHAHDDRYYTKAQAEDRYVSASENTTKTGDLYLDGGSVAYLRPDTPYGWARGFWWFDRDYTNLAGIGVFGNGANADYFYIGHGNEPWSGPVFRAYQDRISITNLEVTGAVTGIEAADVGAAPASHTHSQYAESSRVTALEGNAPIIVSALPASPLPGRIYLVTE